MFEFCELFRDIKGKQIETEPQIDGNKINRRMEMEMKIIKKDREKKSTYNFANNE